jgi:hypothetical protein
MNFFILPQFRSKNLFSHCSANEKIYFTTIPQQKCYFPQFRTKNLLILNSQNYNLVGVFVLTFDFKPSQAKQNQSRGHMELVELNRPLELLESVSLLVFF